VSGARDEQSKTACIGPERHPRRREFRAEFALARRKRRSKQASKQARKEGLTRGMGRGGGKNRQKGMGTWRGSHLQFRVISKFLSRAREGRGGRHVIFPGQSYERTPLPCVRHFQRLLLPCCLPLPQSRIEKKGAGLGGGGGGG